eukprot:3671441-Amphidinium_carterae.1
MSKREICAFVEQKRWAEVLPDIDPVLVQKINTEARIGSDMATGIELFAFGRALAIASGINHFLLAASQNEAEGRILSSLPTVHLKNDLGGPALLAVNGSTSGGLHSLCNSNMSLTEILSATDPQQFQPDLVDDLQNVLHLRGLYQEAMWGSY